MVIFDTNAVLRYMLQDNSEMADEVERVLNREICFVPTEVVAEIVYVLNGVYKVERVEITQVISSLLDMENIRSADESTLRHALNTYSETKLDFVDCLLAGYSQIEGNTVFTFDKELKRYLEKTQ